VPTWTMDLVAASSALSTLGRAVGPGLIDAAKKMGAPVPPELASPDAEFTPELLLSFMRELSWHLFPLLAPRGAEG
jgi:hypothetical protein